MQTPPALVEIYQKPVPEAKPPSPPEPADKKVFPGPKDIGPVSQKSSVFGHIDSPAVPTETRRVLDTSPVSPANSGLPVDQEMSGDRERGQQMADTVKAKAPVAPEGVHLAEFEGMTDAVVDANEGEDARQEPELKLGLTDGPASMVSLMPGNGRFVMAGGGGGGMERIESGEAPKGGIRWGLVFWVPLLILVGVGSVCYYFMLQKGIPLSTVLGKIPVISDYLDADTPDPGFRKLSTRDITDRYVDNKAVGQLFVVSGMVESGYAESRGMISLQGELFSDGKMIQEQAAFAGNILSDLELSSMGWDEIKKQMEEGRTDVKVEPGKTIPFMIVFSNFESPLDKVTIELKGSEPLVDP
ncbi:DUF3426 domain-containing protein [Desulfosarcina sp. OttesenSCG-928-A07]|nr:DUF3426 domain-containing protein [Desulfosarcina sp. OttesenSCG-928-G17]MDL2328423.1 DUF3426 domain-containing protein [Desulfosarcina sp. OttesenSCG-928-A07]